MLKIYKPTEFNITLELYLESNKDDNIHKGQPSLRTFDIKVLSRKIVTKDTNNRIYILVVIH